MPGYGLATFRAHLGAAATRTAADRTAGSRPGAGAVGGTQPREVPPPPARTPRR